MAGVWKKTLNYLGLVEEDEDFVDEMPEADTAPVRRMRPQAVREVPAEAEGVVRTIASPRPAVAATGAIHKSEPKRFNEAREVADHFKEGTAVIMNLQSDRRFDRAATRGLRLRARLRARRQDRTGGQPRLSAHAGRRRGLGRGARAAGGRRLLQPVLSGSCDRPRLLAFGPMIAVSPVETTLCVALTVFNLVLLARVIVSWIALAGARPPATGPLPLGL